MVEKINKWLDSELEKWTNKSTVDFRYYEAVKELRNVKKVVNDLNRRENCKKETAIAKAFLYGQYHLNDNEVYLRLFRIISYTQDKHIRKFNYEKKV
jgi:hypothetical protein